MREALAFAASGLSLEGVGVLGGMLLIGLAVALVLATAATANRDGARSEGLILNIGLDDGDTVYTDTLVAWNSAGYLVPIAHGTSGLRFAGVAAKKAVNTSGADGDVKTDVWRKGVFTFVYNGGDATAALVGQQCYAIDDQTVDEDPATATNEYWVGEIVEYISATRVRVQIDQAVGRGDAGVAQAAITSLTDNTGGVANNTLATLSTLTDSPATADDLRDDLVATWLPEIENNFADCAAKINEILVALRGAGIISQ